MRIGKLSLLLILLAGAAATISCGGGTSVNASNPVPTVLSAAPTALNFGSRTVNTTTQSTVTLTNTSVAVLQLQSVALRGSPAFTLVNSRQNVALAPGASSQIQITFDPTATGSYTAELTISDSYDTNTTIPISGTANLATLAVQISPVTAVLQVGKTLQFTASVSGTTTKTVSWLVNGTQGGNSTVGKITSAGFYTAPASVPSSGTVTVSARSTADSTKSAIASIMITATPPPISVYVSPNHSTVSTGNPQQFTATVTGTTHTAVNWLVNGTAGGNALAGSITSAGLYTAPQTAPSAPVTVTAQSAYDPAATANAMVTVNQGTTGHTYYVSTSGSDTNPGTAAAPFATFSKADSVVQAGDTVYVDPGIYSASISLFKSGTASGRIRWVSISHWGAHLIGTSTGITVNGSYVDLEGFDVTSTGSLGVWMMGDHIRVIANYVHDIPALAGCSTNGAAAIGGSNYNGGYNEVIGNVVYHIGFATGGIGSCNRYQGIYLSAPYDTAINNIVSGVVASGIHTWHAATNISIINNTSFGNDRGIFLGAGDAPCYSSCDNDHTLVENNILYKNKSYGFWQYAEVGPNNTYTHNLAFGNGIQDVLLEGPCYGGLSNCNTYANPITGDPLFVNPTGNILTGNYQLQSSSPAIDTGANIEAPDIDFAGGPRPVGAGYDLGAYEHGTTPAAWPYFPTF